jgi:hypothetical protein
VRKKLRCGIEGREGKGGERRGGEGTYLVTWLWKHAREKEQSKST